MDHNENNEVEAPEFPSLHISNHPVLLHKLSILRCESTSPRDYRNVLRELTLNLGYEATADFSLKKFEAKGPLCEFEGQKLSTDVSLVPIMRSGLGMVESMLELLPNAAVYHIGMYKNRGSILPVQYFNRLPKSTSCEVAIVLDPSISTSQTINATCSILKKWGAKSIKIVCAVVSKAGMDNLYKRHPDVQVYAAAIDDTITEDGLISPGIGDSGDRLFSTPYELIGSCCEEKLPSSPKKVSVPAAKKARTDP